MTAGWPDTGKSCSSPVKTIESTTRMNAAKNRNMRRTLEFIISETNTGRDYFIILRDSRTNTKLADDDLLLPRLVFNIDKF
jgi:hypothetical protein